MFIIISLSRGKEKRLLGEERIDNRKKMKMGSSKSLKSFTFCLSVFLILHNDEKIDDDDDDDGNDGDGSWSSLCNGHYSKY